VTPGDSMRQDQLDECGFRRSGTDAKCPFCGTGAIYVRDYTTKYSNPGTKLEFAGCDNGDCNTQWFLKDTETIREEERRSKNCQDTSGLRQ
jgi:hypothetical protein